MTWTVRVRRAGTIGQQRSGTWPASGRRKRSSRRQLDSSTGKRSSRPPSRQAQAAETLDHWVADRTDGDARGAFEAERAREREHRDHILEFADRSPAEADPDPLHEHLRGLDGPSTGSPQALVARPLVASGAFCR